MRTPYRLGQALARARVAWRFALDFLNPRPPLAPDGLPIPPAGLRHLVAGTDDLDWFLRSGRAAVGDLLGCVDGARPAKVLDFGCGCGRVARAWRAHANISLAGVDTNALAVLWCRRRLTFGEFHRSALEAPLPFPDAEFDLTYALSVLTHLDLPQQEHALRELARTLKPDGRLAISLHGAATAKALPSQLRAAFDRSELVVTTHGPQGSNFVNAFHPLERATALFSQHFLVESFRPSGASGNPPQDLYVLRKPSP